MLWCHLAVAKGFLILLGSMDLEVLRYNIRLSFWIADSSIWAKICTVRIDDKSAEVQAGHVHT
jgi:hypothetical protein